MSNTSPPVHRATRFLVSVKGVILTATQQVILLKNERDEWELPGGKLEPHEAPTACVVREIHEELGLHVQLGPLVDVWLYEVLPHVEVLIPTYGCYPEPFTDVVHSTQHTAVGLFDVQHVPNLRMPEGYKQSIYTWHTALYKT